MTDPEQPEPAQHQSAATWAAEALGHFVTAMTGIEQATPDSAVFYDGLCAAVCGTVGAKRAVLLMYDEGRRRVRIVGAFNVAPSDFPPDQPFGVEDSPLAKAALVEDRVIDSFMRTDPPFSRPDLEHIQAGPIAYVPISSGTNWFGVMLVEHGSEGPLDQSELDALWITGKVVAFASAARRATRLQEQARQLTQRLALARRVHEQVIQRLFGIGMILASDHPLDGAARDRARTEVEAAQADLRQLISSPAVPQAPPTTVTLAEEVERLRVTHDAIELIDHSDPTVKLPQSFEPLAQSVLSEAVRNALKHGTPTKVEVSLALVGEAIALTIDSDGPRKGDPGRAGLGLRLAAAEALQVGGLLEFGARGDNGWRVRLLLPAEEQHGE